MRERRTGGFFSEFLMGDVKKYKEEFNSLYFNLTLRTYVEAYYSKTGYITKLDFEEKYKAFENKGSKEFWHNGILIDCSYEIKDRGFLFSLTFEKDLTILKQLENFRQERIFQRNLIYDYPFMVEEYNGKISLHYGLGWIPLKINWDEQKENENIIKNLSLGKKLYSIINPKSIELYIKKHAPKCFADCQEKMQGHSYLELMDCEKLFGKKSEQEMGR